jgi:hypothetical protein
MSATIGPFLPLVPQPQDEVWPPAKHPGIQPGQSMDFAELLRTLSQTRQALTPETFEETGTLGRDLDVPTEIGVSKAKTGRRDLTSPRRAHVRSASPENITPRDSFSIDPQISIEHETRLESPLPVKIDHLQERAILPRPIAKPLQTIASINSGSACAPDAPGATAQFDAPSADTPRPLGECATVLASRLAEGSASALLVALQAVDQGMRVFVRVARMTHETREQLQQDIAALLAEHGMSNAEFAVHETGMPAINHQNGV